MVILMGFYLHIGPYTRFAVNEIDEQIAALERGQFVSPHLLAPRQSPPIAVSA